MGFIDTPRPKDKIRKDHIMRKGFQITILTNPPDNKIFKEVKCPNCQTKVGMFTDGKKKAHLCTLCKQEVLL